MLPLTGNCIIDRNTKPSQKAKFILLTLLLEIISRCHEEKSVGRLFNRIEYFYSDNKRLKGSGIFCHTLWGCHTWTLAQIDKFGQRFNHLSFLFEDSICDWWPLDVLRLGGARWQDSKFAQPHLHQRMALEVDVLI